MKKPKLRNIKAYKGLAVVLVLFTLFSVLLPAFAQNISAKDYIRNNKSSKETYKVGYFAIGGFSDMSSDGTYSGYGHELFQTIAKYSGLNFELVHEEKSFESMMKLLESGEIDVVAGVEKNDDRMEYMDFSAEDIGVSTSVLATTNNNRTYYSGDYANYEGIRIGVIRGTAQDNKLDAFAKEKGFSYDKYIYNTPTSMMLALKKGYVDAILISSYEDFSNLVILEQFGAKPVYLGVKKGNEELLNKINESIDDMDKHLVGWRARLYYKYFLENTHFDLSFTREEKQLINQLNENGTIFNVIINPAGRPYSYFEGDEAKGILVDLFKNLADTVGIRYQFEKTASVSEYIDRIDNHPTNYDVVISSAYDYYESLKRGFIATNTYFTTNIARLNRKGDNVQKEVVGVADEELSYLKTSSELFNKEGQTIIYFKNVDECIEAIGNGEVNTVYSLAYTAQRYVAEDYTNLMWIQVLDNERVPYHILFDESVSEKVVSLFDRAINGMTDTEIQSVILNNTQYESGNEGIIEYIYLHPVVAVISFVIFVVLASLIIIVSALIRGKRKENINIREVERLMTYVCIINEMVLEVNLKKGVCSMFYLGADGKVTTAYEPFYATYSNIKANIHPDDYHFLEDEFSSENVAAMIQESISPDFAEVRIKDASGNYLWYLMTFIPIKPDRKHPKNFAIFLRNVNADRVQKEKQEHALREALAIANNANSAKSGFMSHMSHEIRTPLNAILGYVNLIKDSMENRELLTKYVNSCGEATEHLLGILNEILDFSSIENGKMAIAEEKFSLKKTIESITNIYYPQCRSKDIRLKVYDENYLNEYVIGDEYRVRQVIINLVSNAFKFTNKGGSISLTIKQLAESENKVSMLFSVADTGIGMDEKFLERIFEPFEQESAGTVKKYGGTGLGLSITYNLVNLMGGDIKVRSKKLEGTTFDVVLNFTLPDGGNVNQNASSFKGVRVLCLSDFEESCIYLKKVFEDKECECDTALSQMSAIEKLKKAADEKKNYDIFFIDGDMHGTDIREFVLMARRVVSSPKFKVVVSVSTEGQLIALEDDSKITKILRKPVFTSVINELMREFFEKGDKSKPEEKQVDLSGKKVLLVEDNAMNLEIAKALLTKNGLVVESAENGQEAVDKFRQFGDEYEIVLMDIQMPVMNGYDATKAIRALGTTKATKVPIIALTANAFTEDVSKAFDSGMNDYLAKPINFKLLIETIGKYLD